MRKFNIVIHLQHIFNKFKIQEGNPNFQSMSHTHLIGITEKNPK